MIDQPGHACPLTPTVGAPPTRRGVISNALMIAGLVAGYGLGLAHFFRYLVPLRKLAPRREMFVGTLADLPVGTSITVTNPRGEGIALARVADRPEDPASGFRALSSTCPHLGCRVHWEAGKGEFLCPCHQGVFDPEGIAVSGPPAKEGKNLARYEVKVDAATGQVYVMVTEPTRYGA